MVPFRTHIGRSALMVMLVLLTAFAVLIHAGLSSLLYRHIDSELLGLAQMESQRVESKTGALTALEDTVVTDEIKFGDNDTLGALVANLIEADWLVILTDQQGLFTADPRRDATAKLLARVAAGDVTLEAMAGGAGSALGKGGMITKVLAAKRAAASGAHTVVASGREADVLVRLAGGETIGTRFIAQTGRMAARKKWLADHLQLRGSVSLDAGAVRALKASGKSLLPIGVVAVSGDFERGEAVACLDPDGREVARGLVNYSSSETRLIMRRPSTEIEGVLGFIEEPELIHRDNLVLR